MRTGTEYAVITTTFPGMEPARRVARLLVERRLAACAQLLPIESVYAWRGEIHEEAEVKLLVKSKAALAGQVMAAIRENHPYEVPEIVHIPIAGGSPEYLKWIGETTL